MEEIIRYDRMGFIPSKNIDSLEEYKQESREKLSFLHEIKDDPEKVLYEKFGKKLRAELYEPPHYLEEEFKEVTLTNTWPGVITEGSEFGKITLKDTKPNLVWLTLFPFWLLNYFIGEGRALSFGGKIRIPTITYQELSQSIEENYTHELVHGIRGQFISSTGEIYSWKIQDKVNNTNKFSAFRTGAGYGAYYTLLFGYNTPLLAVSLLFYLHLSFAPLVGIPLTAYHFYRMDKKFEKFVEKCKNEKLNPYYLLLRSDLKEYKLNRSITEQVKKKDGLRWDIIRLRMEKDF